MENNTEHFLKNKLSINELGLESPDLSLVNEAREKILVRRQFLIEKPDFISRLRQQFEFLFSPVPVGIAAICIISGIFYFTSNETQKSDIALHPVNATANYSISSSTVLASLTQYTNNKTATASSTVLTSIITFVVRN